MVLLSHDLSARVFLVNLSATILLLGLLLDDEFARILS